MRIHGEFAVCVRVCACVHVCVHTVCNSYILPRCAAAVIKC